MKNCKICGEENQDVSKYCHMCGFKFVGEELEEEILKPVQRQLLKQKVSLSDRLSGIKLKKDIIFIFIIIAILVCFAFYAKTSTPNNKYESDVLKGLQMMEQQQKRKNGNKSSWDFKYKNEFKPETKERIDFFE